MWQIMALGINPSLELFVHHNLPFLDLPKMANGSGNWQIWQCIIWSINVQTSYGCLKVSKFNQESISEV